MYEADSDAEGQLERVYLEPKSLRTVAIYSDDDTNSTNSDGEYDWEHHRDVNMRM